MHPPESQLWRIEVGLRAAFRTETLSRDSRWWEGLGGCNLAAGSSDVNGDSGFQRRVGYGTQGTSGLNCCNYAHCSY